MDIEGNIQQALSDNRAVIGGEVRLIDPDAVVTVPKLPGHSGLTSATSVNGEMVRYFLVPVGHGLHYFQSPFSVVGRN
jgi:hypothetical protein